MTNLKNKITTLTVAGCTVLLLAGCSPSGALDQRDLTTFLNSEKSKLMVSKSVQEVNYACKLRTPEVLVLNHARTEFSSAQQFEAEAKKYSHETQFVVVIKDDNRTAHAVRKIVYDPQSYGYLVAYANTDMNTDFELKTGSGAIIPCSMVHLEPANSVQPVLRFTLSFNYARPAGEDVTLVFNDKVFNNGPIKFYYSSDVMDGLPKLKI